MFVRPSQIAQIVNQHPEIVKGRLVVETVNDADSMVLHCETTAEASVALVDAIVATVRQICNLRGEVVCVPVDSLANDGKVIDDLRPVAS
jgi:phenylacetate-CoA ligase